MTPPTARVSLLATSVAATQRIAAALAELSRPGDIIVLAGEMGAGKTAFAQGFGGALGVSEPITSPTFTLVHSYDTTRAGRRLTLHHADVYRLEQLGEVTDLAFGELAEFDGIVLVEWGDVVAASLGDHVTVRLDVLSDESDDSDDRRCIAISASGSSWARRWSALERALGALGLESC